MSTADNDANENYKKEVMSAGTWINKEFLEEVIGSELKCEVKVLDFETKPAVAAGDNYLSILHKAHVNYTIDNSKKILKLIIKGPPTSELLLHVIEEMQVFHKEMTMYSKCLPFMEMTLKENFPNYKSHIAPQAFPCTRSNTLVIEDLTVDGYEMANRRSQMDYEHSVVALRTLARFHALSAKLHQEDPDLIMSVAKETIVESSRETHGKFIDSCFLAIISEVENKPELSRFADILREASQYAWDKLIPSVKPGKYFNTLNHGDFWTNNILFKYNDDKSIDNAKLIDFQLTRYVTPVIDLMYFFFSSVQPDVLENKWLDLVDKYHESLVNDMNCLKIKIEYTKEQLHEDMRDRVIYAIVILTQILPLILAPPSERLDVNKGEGSLEKNYKNPRYLEVLGRYLTHMEKIGYLEDLKNRTKSIVDSILAKQMNVAANIIQ